jgi:acyl transferase domain-containing protein/NADPH:quinone reductase-like Zn-dependent oxidoreductase/acyl carrier protein/SAM-dependent methyltransferase
VVESSDNRDSLQRLKRALLALEKMRSRIAELESAALEPIAVVGLGVRMPGGCDSPDSFWNLLRDGIDATSEVPPDRWDVDAFYDPDPAAPGKMYTRRGAFVDHLREFDAQFFRISPREARSLDPQQRLALEVSWEALENAGIAPDRLAGSSTGVFLGIASTEYFQHLDESNHDENDIYVGTGNTHSAAAGRISFVLGAQGPSIAVDTACSSSLVSVHLACQSLRNRECSLALAGGVNRLVVPQVSVHFSKVNALSRDGRCKTFDASADGYGRGEGCGFVVLKRLSDAVRERHRVHALIIGSAVNHDGASSGLTVPSGRAQQAVLEKALDSARLRPEQVSYVEAHGTGTPLGDPIEIRALQAVYGKGRSSERPLVVGSVKTNIGHLEPAAGIAGLIKTVLSLEHGEIPAHLHVREYNPHVAWDDYPLLVPHRRMLWPGRLDERLAGVSAFGFSGTNAHVIVQGYEARPAPAVSAERPLHVLTLSAKTRPALADLAARFRAHLEKESSDRLADICFTANAGRCHFQHRLAMIVEDRAAAVRELQNAVTGSESAALLRGNAQDPPRIAFLFTGQGSQYAGMGRALYDTQPTFRRILDECDEILRQELNYSFVSMLYGPRSDDDGALHETRHTQPILFTLEYALARLWESWGVRPVALLGHSIGEYVAAVVAGILGLKDALRLVAARGRLMGALPAGGGMAAIRADEATVRSALRECSSDVSIAAVNGPSNTVISGTWDGVETVMAALRARGVIATRLNVSHAFHSSLMDPILADFRAVAREIEYRPPRLTLVSNVLGTAASDEFTRADYWVRQLREPVRFAQGVEALSNQNIDVFLEVGPATTLLGMSRQCLRDRRMDYLPTLSAGRSDWQTLLTSLAALYARGAPIDWEAFDSDYRPQRVELPTYPFQRQRFWIDSPESPERRAVPGSTPSSSPEDIHPLLGRRLHLAHSEGGFHFESALSTSSPAFLDDHRVLDTVVAPGAVFLEMALAAATHIGREEAWEVTNVSFEEKLVVGGAAKTVQLSLSTEPGGRYGFVISSGRTDPDQLEPAWIRHAAGLLAGHPKTPDWAGVDLASLRARCRDEIPSDVFYARCRDRGIDYGKSFRALDRIWRLSDGVVGHVRLGPELAAHTAPYRLHPALLDACFQTVGLIPALAESTDVWVPMAIERLLLLRQAGSEAWSYVWLRPPSSASSSELRVDGLVYGPDGELLAVVDNLRVARVHRAGFAESRPESTADWLYDVQWRAQQLEQSAADAPIRLGPTQIKQRLVAELPDIVQQRPVLESYLQGFTALEEAALRFVLDAFQELGPAPAAGTRFTSAELASRWKIVPRQRRLFARLLEVVAGKNLIGREGDQWIVSTPLSRGDGAAALADTVSRYPAIEAEATLLGRSGPRLAEVLTGSTDPLQLMFPGGDLSAATRVYRDSPGSELMNHLLSRAVASFLETMDESLPLRVLEIGGGTGATTSFILPLLPRHRTEYLFTDISPLFIARMKSRSGDVPFLTTSVLDIERDPVAQGLVPHSFDIVIAAQVLHATQDTRQTLTHVRSVLSPRGLFVLLEPTSPCLSTELVTGLLEGWWRFQDFHLRPSGPLLSAPEWETQLSEVGFRDVTSISPTEAARTSVEAAVVLAQLEPAASRRSRRWVFFADRGGIAARAAARLRRRGDRCILVFRADAYRKIGACEYEVDGRSAFDLTGALREMAAAGDEAPGIVYLWHLDAGSTSAPAGGDVADASRDACVLALHCIQSLLRPGASQPRGLWIVTRGAVSVSSPLDSAGLAASTLWGLGKVVTLERPDLQTVLLDLDPGDGDSGVSSLLNELDSESSNEQVLVRDGKRFVARLARSVPPAPPELPEGRGYSLTLASRGSPDNLRLVPANPPPPGEGQVQVRVRATGLNFADVMDALGLLPFERPALGVEFAGEIARIGEDVQGFSVGDRVFGAAPSSFDSHVTVRTSKIRKIPGGLDFHDAATITVAFATAYYALHHVAEMTDRDRVLIHAAAGGVGLAAIQLAQAAGAEVFATAHPDKWLRLKERGVQHVMSSRSTAFAEEVLARTNGEGVDIVLNSLAGDMIPKSLSALRRGGRFVEIGKSDVWTAERVAATKQGIRYSVVDLLSLMAEPDNAVLDPVLDQLLERFADGRLTPLPRTVFSIDHVVDGFRYMQQARHFGKVVVDHPSAAVAVASDERPVAFRETGTYLIVGGTGGLGLVAAEWLVARRARHIVLMSRRAPADQVAAKVQHLQAAGATIVFLPGDVAKSGDVSAVLRHIRDSMPPLRGILHSALALDDAVLANQSAERFDRVFAPKVRGSWYLHEQTSGMDLDFFILFSAGASLLGNPGQANYAAANAFLDSLAYYRRRRGLPGMSINWGPWATVGAAAARGLDDKGSARGIGAIAPEQGIEILDRLYARNPIQVGVLPIRWHEVAEHFVEWPFVSELRDDRSGTAADPAFLKRLDGLPADEKRILIAQQVRGQLARVLGLDDADVEPTSGFFDLGMDSLTAVELRNKLQATFGITLPPTLAFDYPTVGGLIDYVSREVLSEPEAVVDTPSGATVEPEVAKLLDEVGRMTDLDALASLKKSRLGASR